ncbi:MAG: hypothetical protein ACOYK6_02235 [Chthoniobacterales bacterium]
MAVSPTSNSRTREAADILSVNYTGDAPLSTTPTRSDAIRNELRPNIPAQNPNKDKSLGANSNYMSQYIPGAQGGKMGLKETNDQPGIPVNKEGLIGDNSKPPRPEKTTDPTKAGYAQDSLLNLLVAGNQNNLDRRIRATQKQDKKIQGDLVDKQQSVL